jgi:ATP-binding cassette, subfamily F, member 3
MREALIAALAEYQGAVIIVSHDRSLIDATCDRLWLVAEGTVKPFDGDLDDYTKLVLESRGGSQPERQASATIANVKISSQTRVSPQTLKRRVEQAEAGMAKLNSLIARVDEALSKGDVYRNNPERAEQLARDRAGLQEKLEAAELEWLEAQDALEAIA